MYLDNNPLRKVHSFFSTVQDEVSGGRITLQETPSGVEILECYFGP